ncbi:MAG: nucleoside 2-deoxyribosyltransferase [Candidatus Moranbacteria bacterium]|nr:nucleoside 2-deoxyribosyltransferase [Candidatus Moranbacteria bacterium]
MKIYFAGSIRGGRDDLDIYIKIINYLKNFGEVLTEHISKPSLTSFGENHTTDDLIHDRDMKWLESCDIIIAEVTNPSLGVGYEIGRAVEKNKKIICLYRKQTDRNKRLSAMINGCEDVVNEEYDNFESAKRIIDEYLK